MKLSLYISDPVLQLAAILKLSAKAFSHYSITDLKEHNETLKLYVDNLLARVMEECPDALSSSNNNSRRPSRAKTRTLTV